MSQTSSPRQLSPVQLFQLMLRRKGWPHAVAWAHRISGILLCLYAGLHIITLSGLDDPARFTAKMETFSLVIPGVFEWLLGVPVIFHSLNGGRLLLYELFVPGQDRTMITWVASLSCLYLLLLATFMTLGNQEVSAVFFWLYLFALSSCLTYVVISRLMRTAAGVGWKLHRVSAAFLLLMIPAHMLFMHLDPAVGRDAEVILQRLNSGFIKTIDFLLLTGVLYHGAYGLINIGRDYWSTKPLQRVYAALVVTASIWLGWTGILLLFSV